MALFGRRRRRSGTSSRGVSRDRSSTKEDLAQLRTWASARTGVEAYLEPRTSVTDTTLLLVAGDGEFTRRRISSASAAADFARTAGIPIYDINRVGTPSRMREYAQRMAAKNKPVRPATPGAVDVDAIATLANAAAAPVPTDPDAAALRELWRTARSRAHPDRQAGNRAAWDAVEAAARSLGLTR
jgi:hypothetical protein